MKDMINLKYIFKG